MVGSSRWGKVEKGLVGPYNTEDVDSDRSTELRAGSAVRLSHCVRTDNVCHYNTYAFRGAAVFDGVLLDSAVAHR